VEVVASVVAKSGLPFVTVDFVLRADGVWRVVELGDGQVSDRPVTMAPEVLVAALFSPARESLPGSTVTSPPTGA
jgi:hypothetical protein